MSMVSGIQNSILRRENCKIVNFMRERYLIRKQRYMDSLGYCGTNHYCL